MDKLEKEFQILKDQINLDDRFNYGSWVKNFEQNDLFTKAQIDSVGNQPNDFRKNIELKRILNTKFKESSNPTLGFWFIQTWGGISTFKNKDTNKNPELISKTIKNALEKKFLPNLQCISSLSKVTSVVDIENQVIYDSRVIYALNWLLLKTGEKKFFPIPEGRGSIVADFNIGTLINFKFHNEMGRYYSPKLAHKEFCTLIKNYNEKIFPDNKNEPFYLEMLLFSALPKEIIEDIKDSVKIEIKYV